MKQNSDMDFEKICAEIGVRDEKAKEAIMKYYELSEDDKKLDIQHAGLIIDGFAKLDWIENLYTFNASLWQG